MDLSVDIDDATVDAGMEKWNNILEEIITGFEAAQRLTNGVNPVMKALRDEWKRRYPGQDWCYLDTENQTDYGVPWEVRPEYEALEAELDIKRRAKQWEDEQMRLFHRGFILMHQYYFDLQD